MTTITPPTDFVVALKAIWETDRQRAIHVLAYNISQWPEWKRADVQRGLMQTNLPSELVGHAVDAATSPPVSGGLGTLSGDQAGKTNDDVYLTL